MEEIKRRANQYFIEFEGRHLYPRLFSWYWAAWLMSAVAFGFTAVRALAHPPAAHDPWRSLMFVSELIFLGLCAIIGNYKTRKVQFGAPKGRPERNAFMDGRRQAALERICGIDASKFAAAAKECSDLMGLQKQFRVQADTSAAEMMRYLYDPDSKARILTLLLATVATFVALLNHSAGPEDFNVLAAWDDPGFMRLFVLVMTLAVAAFGMWIGARLFVGVLLEAATSFWAISVGSRRGSKKALNYFVRDLLRLHQPARTDAQPTTAAFINDMPPAAPVPPQRELKVDASSLALARVVEKAS